MAKGIALTGKYSNGKVAIVDDDEYESLNAWNWRADRKGYARRSSREDGRYVTLLMHRVVTNAPSGMEVDHVNGDRLDNRKSNLRLCTRLQNSGNLRRRASVKTRFIGLRKRSNGWAAEIKHNYAVVALGVFATEEEAAKAYDAAALQHRGVFAVLNFPLRSGCGAVT